MEGAWGSCGDGGGLGSICPAISAHLRCHPLATMVSLLSVSRDSWWSVRPACRCQPLGRLCFCGGGSCLSVCRPLWLRAWGCWAGQLARWVRLSQLSVCLSGCQDVSWGLGRRGRPIVCRSTGQLEVQLSVRVSAGPSVSRWGHLSLHLPPCARDSLASTTWA